MGKIKKKNKWAAIGLVALTIFVIVAIVLVVYFVNKNSQPVSYTQVQIAQVVSDEDYTFSVDSIDFVDMEDEEYSKLTVNVLFTANKTIKLKESSFVIDGASLISSDAPAKLTSGESVEITLLYKVKKGQELFLKYDTYKVALGSTF